jgi:hypothetical protein
MGNVRPVLKVLDGRVVEVGKTPLEAAYEHFRLDRMSNRTSTNTLDHYDAMVQPLLAALCRQA